MKSKLASAALDQTSSICYLRVQMPSLKPVFGTAWGHGKWQSPKTVGMTGKVQEENRQESKKENISCPLSLQSLLHLRLSSTWIPTHLERKISKIASMHPGQQCSNLLKQSQTIGNFSHQCLKTQALSPLLYLLQNFIILCLLTEHRKDVVHQESFSKFIPIAQLIIL